MLTSFVYTVGMEQKTVDELRTRLLEEQHELLAGETDRRAGAATVELDQTRTGRLSRMDALQSQEMAKASNQRATQRAQLIAAALRRIDEGEFGECRGCGEAIALRRLEADPCALFCIMCAEARTG